MIGMALSMMMIKAIAITMMMPILSPRGAQLQGELLGVLGELQQDLRHRGGGEEEEGGGGGQARGGALPHPPGV